MRASGEEREGLGLCGGIKRGVAREKKKKSERNRRGEREERRGTRDGEGNAEKSG